MKALTIPPGWPFRDRSRHIACRPHLWHVQDMGEGPAILLIHGAGASSHSFRHLIPLLHGYRAITLDVAGQGFTVNGARHRCGLEDIAGDIARLVAQERWPLRAIIGHSAGAAIALRLADLVRVQAVIGINAALGPFEGVQGWLFPAAARLLSMAPLVPTMVSKLAGTPMQVDQLLATTGSRIDAEGAAQYLTLVRMPSHVAATLDMMAQWRLDSLTQRLPAQTAPCLLITASGDLAVPPAASHRAAQVRPGTATHDIPGLGHLVHEEAAALVAAPALGFLAGLAMP